MATQYRATLPPIYTIPEIPEYSTFQHLIAVGKNGVGPGELNTARSISIEDDAGQIYVSDTYNDRIQVFSEEGDYLNQFGAPHLDRPYGILIHEDAVYVSDWGHHAVFKFSFPGLSYLTRVGKYGFRMGEFKNPHEMDISSSKYLYVTDCHNDRLQILDLNLHCITSVRHRTLTYPADVKFSADKILVLSFVDNPCIHIFNLSGEKIGSIITRGEGMQVTEAYFFCLDRNSNIIISDSSTSSIKVFSFEGELVHTIDLLEFLPDILTVLQGVAILKRTKLVVVTLGIRFGLHIWAP